MEQVEWGSGNVADAMRRAVNHYQESGAADPSFIVTQVGDEPWDKAEVRSMLQNTASLGIFWLFVGFGRGKLALPLKPLAQIIAVHEDAGCDVGDPAAWFVGGDGEWLRTSPLLWTRLDHPKVRKIWADQGFAGCLVDWAAQTLSREVEIDRKDPDQRGFQVQKLIEAEVRVSLTSLSHPGYRVSGTSDRQGADPPRRG
ncbi:hypothetical protein [Streptomyces sp. YIM S03343]